MPPSPTRQSLDLEIELQPDDATCGPTCLQAVYRYYGDLESLEDVIAEVPQLETGGTLAANLAIHALKRGVPRRRRFPPSHTVERVITTLY